MEHSNINARLRGDRDAQPDRWFAISPAVRTKDFALASTGRYCTAFEALCTLAFVSPQEAETELLRASSGFLELIDAAGLDRTRLSITLFGGGSFLGRDFARDDIWYEAWRALGILERQINWVAGPKLYMLFIGEGERSGPRCEVAYGNADGSLLEVGTLIRDCELVRISGNLVSFEPTVEQAIGCAVGAERLLAVANGMGVYGFGPYTILSADIRRRAAFWSEDLNSEVPTLLDALKTALFLDALCTPELTQAQKHFVRRVHERAVRKLFLLGLAESRAWVSDALSAIAGTYVGRYPGFDRSIENVERALFAAPLRTAWNPENYVGSARSETSR